MPTTTMPRVQAVTSNVGAVIEGVDLRAPDAETMRVIRETVCDRGVVFFHGQDLDQREFETFLGRFAPVILEPFHATGQHQELVGPLSYDPKGRTDVWHSDTTFMTEPPRFTGLRAVELPPVGGDTCWGSMYAAYDALSEPMRDMLDHLTAVHSMMPIVERMNGRIEWFSESEETYGRENVHPMVSVHPETGRKALYVSAAWTTRIVELRPAESTALLDLLFEHVKSPDFTMRWRWTPEDVAVWDNRVVQHYAVPDYEGGRVMYRGVTAGDRPTGPATA